ncbi:Signal recognition particle 68 [Carabus blaptoides fortunei]
MAPKDTMIETPEDVAPKPVETKLFSLEILKLIRDSQQQHGLRHGDYQRYRGYCSRRIRRLRKVLKVPQGDRRHFKRRDVTETHLDLPKADERYLHIPLVLAERAWAYAMQIRQEANTEPRKKFHLIQRLRKACVHALQLEELCKSDKCDARAKLETQAYVAWMHGTLQFELQLWQNAAENLKKAQLVYETIAKTLAEDEQAPYRHRVDELAPSLRYCAYNIGDEKAVNLLELRGQGLIENLDSLMVQAQEKRSEDIMEVTWHGLNVIVRPEKVKLFLLSIKDLDESLARAEDLQARIALIEQLLIDCRDAVSVAREELRVGATGAQLLLTYLLYVRLTRTVERNQYLIQQTKKPQDIVRLYEIILQQMAELKQLSGMEQNEVYQKEIAAQTTMYRAYRCYHMAKAYTITRRWREALVLYTKATKYIKELQSAKTPQDLKSRMAELQKDIEMEEIVARAQSVIEDTEEQQPAVVPAKVQKSKKPLIERLDEYREDPQLLTKSPNVVTLPPAMEAIPCKPLFFDLAFNLVKFPDLQDKFESQNKAKSSSGMTGFVKGLFGWGGNK